MDKSFPRVVAKTADFTIAPPMDRDGTLFTNRGATGAVVATLPAPGLALKGYAYYFMSIANYDFTVAAGTADTAVVINDAAADSLAMSTSSQKIGGLMMAVCDGTAWAIVGLSVGHTFTVAT